MSDQEMIERVAKAILEELQNIGYGVGTINAGQLSDALGRAAIKAMREPTKKMVEAFDEASPMYDDPNTTGEEYWTTAIDSILND